jgi:tetratricopeptide (TPR) repeat protein
MRGTSQVRWLGVVVVLVGVPVAGAAQSISQGFDLERQGRTEQAATMYFTMLRGEPASLPALLGLERVLPTLGRLPELLAPVQRALQTDTSAALMGLALRTYVALAEDDSAVALTRRWAATHPHDPSPWREWAIALQDHIRFDDARAVLEEGRRTLGTPAALAIELAELDERTGDWTGAALSWAAAAGAEPAHVPNAVSQLDDAPADQRDRVLRTLTASAATLTARRIAAELMLGWGQPERAWETLAPTLDPPTPEGAVAVRRFAQLSSGTAPGMRRAHGLALARLADMMPGPLAARARAEAARALLDAGDRTAARALLLRLIGDSSAPADAQAMAQTALIDALIADGALDSAAAALGRLETDARASGDDRERLRLALADAWIHKGRLSQADDAIGADSSVEALALRGWVRLYHGDLHGALEAFRSAGPYAGDREAATARTGMIALLEGVGAERSPELGTGLLTLARGDSAGAIGALRHAADRLPDARGRPDVLLLAARIAARLGRTDDALELFAEVVHTGGTGAAAPAAELEWARVLLGRGNSAEAVAHLEHLILTYPQSAVVPEARRTLERAKGAIPRS